MKSGMQIRLNPDQASRYSSTPQLVTVLLLLVAVAGLTACERNGKRQRFNQLSESPVAPMTALKQASR